MNFENKFDIGTGCYSASEIAHILNLPYAKVRRWMMEYWDGKLGKEYGEKYSWTVDSVRAVSFHTLVEFYVMMELSESGVKPKEVLKAHQLLSRRFDTAFPFALKSVLIGLKTDGGKVFLRQKNDIISLDGTNQLNLQLINAFFKNLDFDNGDLASRYWPLGKKNSIVVDPSRKFGHPIIDGHNISPEIIKRHITAGDPVKYVAMIYELTEKEVMDAIKFCQPKIAA